MSNAVWSKSNVALFIIVLVAVVSLALIVYETVVGAPTPAIVQTLLGVVLGFLGQNLASAQGATQALAQPTAITQSVPLTGAQAPSVSERVSTHDAL